MKRTLAALAVAMFAVMGLSLVAAPAVSSPVFEVSAGQFCAESDHGKIKIADNGDTVQCTKGDDNKWRWKKISPLPGVTSSTKTPSQSTSASSSAKPSGSASASSVPSKSASTTPVAGTGLPVTGAPVPLVVVAGIVLVALGVGAVVLGRRRNKVQTEA